MTLNDLFNSSGDTIAFKSFSHFRMRLKAATLKCLSAASPFKLVECKAIIQPMNITLGWRGLSRINTPVDLASLSVKK